MTVATAVKCVVGIVLLTLLALGVILVAADWGHDDDTPAPVWTSYDPSPPVISASVEAPVPPISAPTSAAAPSRVSRPAATRAYVAPARTKPAAVSTSEPASVYYKNCSAVWAAIDGPIYRGQPGYAPHLDTDGDGVGCEEKP